MMRPVRIPSRPPSENIDCVRSVPTDACIRCLEGSTQTSACPRQSVFVVRHPTEPAHLGRLDKIRESNQSLVGMGS
jgi:hypothetical protein